MKIKLDKSMINRHIEVFENEHDRYPYFICNKDTYEMLPKPEFSAFAYCGTININDENKEKPEPVYLRWQAIKVFIDNELPSGEVIFA